MINKHVVRKYAEREMLHRNSLHAVYGLQYVNNEGFLVEKLAEDAKNIRYFDSDSSYTSCSYTLEKEYKDVRILAVHKNMGH